MHAKYIDDLTLATSLDYKKVLVENPDLNPPLPLNYHERNNQILPDSENPMIDAWSSLNQYVAEHDMKLNYQKTKVMLFNPGRN